MTITAMIVVTPDLSAALIQSADELRYLADQRGAVTFPLLVSGRPPRLAVQPDLHYIAQRVLASKGEELIGHLLQKALGGDR